MLKIIQKALPKDKNDINGRNMYFYVLNGILYTLVTNLYKPFAQKFIYRLGGGETHVSLFNSLPGLVALFAIIPGVIYISRAASKKKILANTFFLSRFITLLYAVVPFMPLELQPITFVIITAMMSFPESISTTALQSFTADVFDEDNRARAITQKNKYTTFASFISLIILAQLLELFGRTNGKAIMVYQVFFVLAFAIGLFEIYTFNKMKETTINEHSEINLKESLKEVFSNKAFLGFLACSLTFHFGWQMGWSLFSIYQIDNLMADETWITILGVTSNIVMFFSFNYWSRLIQKKGNSHAATFATFGMAATPVLYVLSRNLYVLTVSGLIMGFFTAGTVTVILNFLLEVSPQKNRIMYVAVHATLTNVTLFIGPLISDMVLKKEGIYIALLVTAFFRFLGSMAFLFRSRLRKA